LHEALLASCTPPIARWSKAVIDGSHIRAMKAAQTGPSRSTVPERARSTLIVEGTGIPWWSA